MSGSPLTGSAGGGSSGPPGSSITYQPGGTAAPGVYTSWATAVAAAQDLDGLVTIAVDASLGTPTFSDAVDLERRIRVVAFGPSLPVSATIASGAVMQNASYFEGITFAGTLSASVFTTTDGSPHDLTFAGCARAETADAADLIELATGANKISFLGSSAFTSASRAAVTLASGKNVTLQVSNTASLGASVVAGSAGTLTANVAAAASLSTSGFSGTLSRTNADTEAARTTAVDAAAGWDGPEQGFGTDGAVSYSAGGAASALTAPMYATNLTISPNGGTPTTLSMAAYPVMGTGTLTLGTNCVLHHNGTSVAANTQAGGTAAATGHLGNTQQAGANGGAINSSGGNATTQSNALGAAGGSGGKGSQPGGTSPAATFPVPASVGRWISSMFLFCLSGSFTKPAGGGGGSSGGGDVDSTGSGGGSGGGVAKVCFKSIVMGSGAKISCDGGAGGSNSNGAGGGGGGGGGYLEVHCDELTLAVADDYASHFTCAGGAGGTATGGGVSGSAGSAGRVRVYKRGKLVYST